MNNCLKHFFLCSVLTLGLASCFHQPPFEKNAFQFEITQYETKRQGGQTLNIYIKYVYTDHLPNQHTVDYRLMRHDILKWMEPSDAFPRDIYWEILATEIGRELLQKYPIEGVSVFIEVLDNPNGSISEPGNHGPVFTSGKITPLDIHH